MFYYLKGIVAHKDMQLAVIDCNGVGYACKTTAYSLSALNIGEEGKLLTYVNVKEDAIEIYGFTSSEELNLFKQLISVSGVGPKVALDILSSNIPSRIAMAIITGDDKTLSAAKGIGPKIAKRIVLELKDKLAKATPVVSSESYGGSGTTIIPEDKTSEATAALTVLGYSPAEISSVFREIDMNGMTLEQVIRAALQWFAGNLR